jgi:hypothetical protein
MDIREAPPRGTSSARPGSFKVESSFKVERETASIMYACTFGDTVFVTKCVGTLLLCVNAYVRSKYAVYFQLPTPPAPKKKRPKRRPY